MILMHKQTKNSVNCANNFAIDHRSQKQITFKDDLMTLSAMRHTSAKAIAQIKLS